MPEKGKKNRKVDRHRKSAQNTRYKNEHRREQNKLRRLQKHISAYGITGRDALEAERKLCISLGRTPPKRSHYSISLQEGASR